MPQDPSWLTIVFLLASGFVLLAKGAGWLVGGATHVARRAGVNVLVVGLTVVAFGTSAPEIVVSAVAAWQGESDISLGNVLGSNVANVGLVLGACAVVLPKVLESRLSRRELFWLFTSLGVLWWIVSDRAIGRAEAGFLLALFAVYNVHVALTAREGAQVMEIAPTMRRPGLWVAAGIACISLGAKLVVDGAKLGALELGLPESVVALTVVAIGTSLPELAAGLGGALRGESDISLGNVVGSNVFNLLAVIGLVALLQPLDPAHPRTADPDALRATFDAALREDLWVVLGFSLAAVLLPYVGERGGRVKGAALLVAYAGYVAWLVASRGAA